MKVLRAMNVLGSKDFWELTRGPILRDETKNYVPAIQAATIIGREPERYGFTASQSGPLSYEVAPVPQSVRLAQVAALTGVSLDTLRELNPELYNRQTPPGGTYLLKFPIGTSQRFVEARLQGHRITLATRDVGKPEVHVVKPRDPPQHRQALRHVPRVAPAPQRPERGSTPPSGRTPPHRRHPLVVAGG